MFSQFRNYRKSFENFQDAIEKHLNGDFLVHEYLNQNQLQGHNIDDYSKLYNSLLVTKNQKKNKYDTLKVNYAQMSSETADENLELSKIQNWVGKKDNFCHWYQEIQQNISTELEVKNTLWKEIVEMKKSLNLLKGDIGHIIGRNESAKILSSKISKVKIVADDQLKRVSSAFVKDKDQFKTREDMQKKFTKKLKNVSMFEDSTLKRLKKTYTDTMLKKKEIHDRLNYIQKIGSSINKTGQKEKLKNQKNRNILELYSSFMALTNLIIKVPEAEKKLLQNSKYELSNGMHQFVSWLKENQLTKRQDISSERSQTKSKKNQIQFSSIDLEMITEQNLESFEKLVIVQYRRIKEEIQNKISLYDMQMKKNEQLIMKLDSFQNEIQRIRNDLNEQMGLKYKITPNMREDYNRKLKGLSNFLKIIFSLLQYVEKNIHYSHHSAKNARKTTQSSSQFFVRKEGHSNSNKSTFQTLNLKVTPTSEEKNINSYDSMICISKNYISELYKTYFALLKENEEEIDINDIQSNIYDYLQSDIGSWLQSIKKSYLKGKTIQLPVPLREGKEQNGIKFRKSSSKLRESRISVLILPKTTKQIEEEEKNELIQEDQFHRQMYMQHHLVDKQPLLRHHHSMTTSNMRVHNRNHNNFSLFNKSSQKLLPQSSIANLTKLKHVTQHHEQLAQRVKLLKDIDQDHYKMLKSTLKMEKQNTRKNYMFTQTFKRAKFSPRDQILEQKRFECSFSVLFAGKRSQLVKKKSLNDSKKSTFYNNGNLQRRLSKLNDSTHSFSSSKSLKLAESKSSFYNNDGKNIKRSTQVQKRPTQLKRNFSRQFKNIINLV